MKISFIGAGSVGFTRKIVADLLIVPELRNVEISLMDIDANNLQMIHRILEHDIEVNRLEGVRLTKTTDRRESLSGAKYIFDFARVGVSKHSKKISGSRCDMG